MKKIFLALSLLCASLGSAQQFPNPQPGVRIYDFAHVLSSQMVAMQEKKLADNEAQTTNQVAVVTVDSLNGSDIADVANKLARQWGIGQKGKNNGVLFLYAKAENRKRIEVGRGLEDVLPDVTAKNILIDLRPLFAANNYDAAITSGIDKILAATAGNYHPTSNQTETGIPGWVVVVIIVVAIIIFIIFVTGNGDAVFSAISDGGDGGSSSGGDGGGFGGGDFGGGGASD